MAHQLQSPLRDQAAWVEYLAQVEIPVLPRTASAIASLAAQEDTIDAQSIAAVVVRDPLMCVKLFRHLAELRRGRQVSDVENVTGCVVMMGIPPFFRAFADLAVVPLAPQAAAAGRSGLAAVLKRAQRASAYASEWAVWRNDLDAEIIGVAALLHEFTEMLLWHVAPALAARVEALLAANPGMRSIEAQQLVYNTGVNALQHALMLRWRLPELLIRITDESCAEDPRVRNVNLAVALARHSAAGWSNAALPDDYEAVGRLLNVSPIQVRLAAMRT
ncbi:MAG: HDOD domain-containing protein [Burkholderiales bacterium]|nr:HDOD domain-containing protein [Burkholderiales bacterium]